MKIRDLDLDQYVIVYDIGKSENNNGMTVVGRVEEIVFHDDGENAATINSLGNLYEITDDNEFELWAKSIEGKTESIGTTIKWNDDGNLEVEDNYEIKVPDDVLNNNSNLVGYVKDEINTYRSNDVQQKKRFEHLGYALDGKPDDIQRGKVELIDSETVEFENGRQMKVIINNGKTKPTSVCWVDDKTIGFDNGSRVTIPENYETKQTNDIVNKPSHYTYGKIEIIDIVEQVTTAYPTNIAFSIGNALKYICRAPFKNGVEDLKKAVWYLNRAIKKWEETK